MARVRGLDTMKRNMRAMARQAELNIDPVAINALAPMRDTINRTAPRPSLRDGAAVAKISGGRNRGVYWIAFKRGIAMRIAHLVELGTAPHSMAKGASRRYGIMQDVPPFHPGTAPEPWVRPAYDLEKEETVARFGRGFMDMITSVIRGVRT